MRPIISSSLPHSSALLLLAGLSLAASGCQTTVRTDATDKGNDSGISTKDGETENSTGNTGVDTGDKSVDTSNTDKSEESTDTKNTSEDSETVEDVSTEVPLFDLRALPDFDQNIGGCAKVDFLFVVDNSGSMRDEQVHLTASFPGFMKGLDEQLDADDFQIMVIDSGNETQSRCDKGVCTCIAFGGGGGSQGEACCPTVCEQATAMTCAGKDCSEFSDKCDYAFGSGRQNDNMGTDCGIADDRRYILNGQADRDDAFACAATAGTVGASLEKMMAAMLDSLSPKQVDAGGCNEGFLRDDAILVVTFITDEEEKVDLGSPGDPTSWYEDLLALKGGDKDSIVMVGIYGDVGEPGGICKELTGGGGTDGAERSPRLKEFVGKFGDLGVSGTVCAEDYSKTFNEAISKISTACSKWDPK